jgi:type IV pilus assembly protein PilC
VAKFTYSAVTAEGRSVTGVQKAVTPAQARIALARRGLQPVKLHERGRLLRFELTKKRVPRKVLMHFSRQLAVFVRAGIPIIDGLEVIAEDTGNKTFNKVLFEMIEALRSGATFSEAAEAQPKAFPPFYLGILRSAELTGNLDEVLEHLSDYIERDVEARQKVVGAVIYPAVVLAMSLASVAILVAYVLPKFTEFFDALGATLPLPTRMIVAAGHFVSSWWWAMGAVVLMVGSVLSAVLHTERGKSWRDTVLLRLPLVGDLARHAILERFCRILSSMVDAGVPLPEALVVTGHATNNRVYRRGLADAREAMMRGEGLAGPLSASGLFPAAARQIFRVGEDTGTLDKQLATAAVYFERELTYKLKRFTSLFEPAVILVAGGFVGFIAVALVSAMYGIVRQVNL